MLRFRTADGRGDLHVRLEKIDAVKSTPGRMKRPGETAGPKAELLVGGRWERIDAPLVDVLAAIAAATPAQR